MDENINDRINKLLIQAESSLERSEMLLSLSLMHGMKLPMPCKICKDVTYHRYEGELILGSDRLDPDYKKYLDRHQVTCADCNSSFYYTKPEIVTKVSKG